MEFVMHTANVRSDARNCIYPNRVVVTSAEELMEAAKFDHVCGEFAKNYRSVSNFLKSNVVVMDCDNDHTDDPVEWITAEKLDEMIPHIAYAIVPSRHHLLPKDNESARPRMHVYFPIEEMDNAEDYAALKRCIQKAMPFFDDNALDAARFIFGADAGEVEWHEGWSFIDEEVELEEDEDMGGSHGPIVAGTRNNTLSRFAGRVLKRYGEGDKAHQIFLDEAAKCDPPLEDSELNTIWFSALKFFRNKVQNQSGYVPPSDYNDDFGGGADSLKPDDYSDIGEAKVLTREYGNELRYSDATDFLRYDGQRWIEDRQLAVGAVEEFLDLQLVDAKDAVERAKKALIDSGMPEDVVKAGNKKIEKELEAPQMPMYFALLAAQQYLTFVMKRRDWKYVTATLNTAKPMLAVDVKDLDKDENFLNTPSGTYDLTKGLAGLREHNPDDLITKMTICAPGDEGMDLWLDALQLFFCGDQELIDYVQMIIGLAAFGKVYQEHLVVAVGTGANGKSTFFNTIAKVLGTYSGKLSAEALTVGCKRNVKPEMAELKGKRLIIASETEEGMRLNSAVVKQLCSTDEIYAERKYRDPFKYEPSHTITLYTNHLPKVGASDDGLWRRLIVIPFNAKITGNSDIKNYTDYLLKNAGPAIMTWIIEGAKKAYDEDFNFDRPLIVHEAIKAYKADNDWLGIFISECCEVDPSYCQKSGDFYQEYRAYCLRTGEYVRSTTDFYAAVTQAGYERRRTSKGSFVYGVQVKMEDFE